jgi:perosamine synthetase
MMRRLSSPVALPSDQDASGRTLGEEEIAALSAAIRSGTLTSTKGAFVKQLESRWAEVCGTQHAFACSHGSAAIHCAIAAIDPTPGDEIVTSPITDMGALTPIMYQGAIPVFADVEPATCNITAESIERVLSDRTRAVIVTHLFGNPCNLTEILAVCRPRGIMSSKIAHRPFWHDMPDGLSVHSATLAASACSRASILRRAKEG